MSNEAPALQEPWQQEKVVLILCGLVGSGKSTFAEQLQLHYPQFRRCSQDDLGDRRQVERLARDCLAGGLSVCIDRTNFNAAQRSYWIEIAREFQGTSIWIIVFDTPMEVCEARIRTRMSHPTIKTPEQGLLVLLRFASEFELPNIREGYNRILYMKPEDHPSLVYSRAEINTILQKVHDSRPLITAVDFHALQSSHERSQGGRNRRGRPTRGYTSRFGPLASLRPHRS